MARARRDNRPDSHLDLAIVLNGRRGDFLDTKLEMAGIAVDVLMETGLLVQPFPMWDGDLAHPERFTNPTLIQRISDIAFWRKHRGLTQQQLADAIGVSQPYIALLEGGQREAMGSIDARLASALRVRADDLLPDPTDES